MSDVFDYAKYFIKQDLDTQNNTFDGNMKLQKLLVLADLVSLAEFDKPLFDDAIYAFRQGCVIEKVRLRYRNDFFGFVEDSRNFNPDFTQDDYDVLGLTTAIFGSLSARELSELNHSFAFWDDAYKKSIQNNGYKNKDASVVTVEAMRKEIDKIRDVIALYRETQSESDSKETINGIDFYYSSDDISMTDEVVEELFTFSLLADDVAYSVYHDNGTLVIA